MVSTDPRLSSLTAGFRASSILPWEMPATLPPLPPGVARGGPLAQAVQNPGSNVTVSAQVAAATGLAAASP